MIFSVAMLLLFGLMGNQLFKLLKLPGLIGMLLVGVLIGPYALDLLDENLLAISEDLRMMALIIILLKAGLNLNTEKLKSIGPNASLMAVLPVLSEGLAIAALSIWLLDFTFVQGGVLGFVIAAVSPAVVVPAMVKLMKKGTGMNKSIPVMILSAASLDDVFAITLFSMFTGIYIGTQTNIVLQLLGIPLAIGLGIALGLLIGIIVVKVFERFHLRDSKKIVLVLALSLFILTFERALEDVIMIASLLSIMTIGVVIAEKRAHVGVRLADKFDKIWVFVKIFLFVLVGAAVDVSVAIDAGLVGLALIALGLLARSIGVMVAMIKSDLNWQERFFAVGAYTPKATVQAAIGSIPLLMGIAGGEIILAIAVLSILLTAPLGAIWINLSNKRLLESS